LIHAPALLTLLLQLNSRLYSTRRKVRIVDLDLKLEKCRDEVAKQQAMLNKSFSCENERTWELRALQKALEAKQVCTPLKFNAVP